MIALAGILLAFALIAVVYAVVTPRYQLRSACAAIVLALLSMVSVNVVQAQARVQVPEASATYRYRVERAAAEYFGIKASPARYAAQIHTESLWQPSARSQFAVGLLQFTPSTAAWLPKVCPELGAFDPWDATQAIRGGACYDAWLYERTSGATECDRWAFTLSGYNGGESWVKRDKQRASAAGADPDIWFANVEAHSARAGWAFKENRTYVERILLRLEPAYIRAGWPGTAVCEAVP